jgi:hypothetical protein
MSIYNGSHQGGFLKMRRSLAAATGLALLLSTSTACLADFQYSETSKMTGGALAGSMKVLGVFSKDARQAGQGTTSTISVKGNRMRRESSQGTAEIIDLSGRRIIQLNLKQKTYSVMTFDEMRARLEEARKKAAEQQAKRAKGENPQLKITPKIQVAPGTQTKQILNYTAKEMKTRIDMEMESQDPNRPGSANTWVTSDSWIAPVKGYDELKTFHMRMAKELDWLPGAVFGSNVQMNMASVELQKSTAKLSGLPLLQYTSMGMGQPGSTSTSQTQPQQQSGNPITKGLGGIFGKKNKQDNSQQPASNAGAQTTAGSLMDMTIEVTSVSTSALDSGLFDVPAGFKQVEAKGLGQ